MKKFFKHNAASMSQRIRWALLCCLVPGQVIALTAMNDNELADVKGQAGLSLSTDLQNLSADQINMQFDQGQVHPTYGDLSAAIQMGAVRLSGVDAATDVAGGNIVSTTTVDSAYNGTSGSAAMQIETSWNRTRLRMDSLGLAATPGESLGGFVLDTEGSFTLTGASGLFASARDAAARLVITDGQWHYRQNSNEFIADNLSMDVGFDQGGINLNSQGLVFDVPVMDWNIQFDMGYRDNPATAYSSADSQFYLRFGWAGTLENFQAEIKPGGVWYDGNTNDRSQGLNLSFRTNYGADFDWIVGSAAGDEVTLFFGDWTNLPNANFAMNAPNITLDAVNAGQEPPGFLYKNVLETTPATSPAFAVAIRDLSFLAYNRDVEVIDPSAAGFPKTYEWGLIYTLGDLDANILLYPDGGGAGDGFLFDASLAVQSPGEWYENSHFMIADTGVDTGIGFINTNFLVDIDQARFEMTSGAKGGLLLSTASGARWQLDAQLGGGNLTDLSEPVRIVDISLNLDANNIDLLFTPPPDNTVSYLGFEWDMNLASTSYLALAEPSRPDVRFLIGDISGDVSAKNGRIEIVAGANTADGNPHLRFEQDLQFGLTAGTQEVLIEDFSIGDNNIGSMVIPGGNWYGALDLKPQLP